MSCAGIARGKEMNGFLMRVLYVTLGALVIYVAVIPISMLLGYTKLEAIVFIMLVWMLSIGYDVQELLEGKK